MASETGKQTTAERYAKCAQIEKIPFVNKGDEEAAKILGANYDIPPLFERGIYEQAFMKHYSMSRNKYLHCRWRQYVKNIDTKQFTPYQLPDVRELHFYNCAIRFLPNESIRHQDHRLTLRPGPGVDNGGQIPIPHEALMKRGLPVKVKTASKIPDKKAAKGKVGGNVVM